MQAMPRPPQPSTTTQSRGDSFGSLAIALNAVSPEHASVAA
jgi:hypothetical protein